MDMSKRRVAVAVLGAVLVGSLTTGCAGAGPGGSALDAPTTTPPGEAVSPSPPSFSVPPRQPGNPTTSPGKGSGNEVTLTGDVVLVEVEGGCLTLRVNNKGYELMGGDRSVLQHGAHVTVRGRVRTDIATICQVGPVLEVLEARPA